MSARETELNRALDTAKRGLNKQESLNGFHAAKSKVLRAIWSQLRPILSPSRDSVKHSLPRFGGGILSGDSFLVEARVTELPLRSVLVAAQRKARLSGRALQVLRGAKAE